MLGLEIHVKFGSFWRAVAGSDSENDEFRAALPPSMGATPPLPPGGVALSGGVAAPLMINWAHGGLSTWYGSLVVRQNFTSVQALISEFETYSPELIRRLEALVSSRPAVVGRWSPRRLFDPTFSFVHCSLVQYPTGYPGPREHIPSITWRRDRRIDRVRSFFRHQVREVSKSAAVIIPVYLVIGFGLDRAQTMPGTPLAFGEIIDKFVINGLWLILTTIVATLVGFAFVALPKGKEGLTRD